ncbi:MAG: tetratricopeptide repeat protein [Anditalea sp.]
MSNLHRIQQLLEFLKKEPDNPFNLYALALEYQKDDQGKAAYYFDRLLSSYKDYLPTYYHAAAFFADMGEIEKAKEVYETGIALAIKGQNQHALKELKNAYLNFQFENE